MFKKCTIMRPRIVLLTGLVLILLAAFFIVPRVFAASCFADTAGHYFETYICWLKTKGITTGSGGYYYPNNNITRGEMAAMLMRMLTIGDTYVSTGPTAWVANDNTPTGYVSYYAGFSWLRGPSTGNYYFSLSPSLPSVLGTRMYLKGVKICYDASLAGAYITDIEFKLFSYSSSGYAYKATWSDTTDRADTGCVLWTFGIPASINGNDQFTVDMLVTITNPANYVRIGVSTFILNPSNEIVTLVSDGNETFPDYIPTINDGGTGE